MLNNALTTMICNFLIDSVPIVWSMCNSTSVCRYISPTFLRLSWQRMSGHCTVAEFTIDFTRDHRDPFCFLPNTQFVSEWNRIMLRINHMSRNTGQDFIADYKALDVRQTFGTDTKNEGQAL